MPSKSVKYASYIELNKKCINISWDSLDRVHDDTFFHLESALDELERAQVKVSRLRKTLKLAEK